MITKIEIDETQIEIIPEAYLARDTAIHKSELVTTVEDAFEAQSASTAMHALNEIVKGMEASRKEAKSPALQAGRVLLQSKRPAAGMLPCVACRLSHSEATHIVWLQTACT